MVDKIGRRMVQLVAFVGSAVFLASLFICTRRSVIVCAHERKNELLYLSV